MHNEISRQFQKVNNFDTLIQFLRDGLRWPIPEGEFEFADVTFDWSSEYLHLPPEDYARIIGCYQLRVYDLIFELPERHLVEVANTQLNDQISLFGSESVESLPWGIFFVEFENDVHLDACRTLIRRVLRGLIGGPNHSASLPFWDYDRLLFICVTTDFQNISFIRFTGNRSRPIVDDYIPLSDFVLNI